MRVHGEKKILRRTYKKEIGHESARKMLEEDFGGLCGYCGKNGISLRERFHVDHFVPQTRDKSRVKDYSNFVWSCPKCNLIKSDQWPTEDIAVPFRGNIGFVDPASDDFDLHLFRNENGRIEGQTELGAQICRLLNFHLRRTELFWKVDQLQKQIEQMRKKHLEGSLSPDEYRYYIEVDMMLNEILDAMYIEKE